jgi:outer membrane protein assembly factor BamD
MERFVNSYPDSEKVEEVAFLGAKSYYLMAPLFSKDPENIKIAIDKLQEFINSYPESELINDANELIFELDYRLEFKEFNIALQYNVLTDYQASIKSFDNFLIDFPGSDLREKALYYRFDSAYKLAINSVVWKQEERIGNVVNYFNSLKIIIKIPNF